MVEKTLTQKPHIPVMLPEVLTHLNLKDNGRYMDCTFGRGGYTRGLLEANSTIKVFAVDRDPTAKEAALEVAHDYPGRFQFLEGCFDEIGALFKSHDAFDGIVWDLGVSSPQLDNAERGFSFRFDGPLDMRMGNSGLTAADIVNTYGQEELANLIYELGEERRSRVVASIICEQRAIKPFKRTLELAKVVRKVVPRAKDKIDPATRTFQALRLAVNDELGQIERSLKQSIPLLSLGGRLVCVTFHSLEDRIVKLFIKNNSSNKAVNKYAKEGADQSSGNQLPLRAMPRKAVLASKDEIKVNARSRSAKLRCAEKIGEGS